MKARFFKYLLIFIIAGTLVSALGWLAFSPCSPGWFALVDDLHNGIAVPENVREDAGRLASELCEDGPGDCQMITDSLLQVYSQAEGKDFLLVFNSGGQGLEEIGPEWESILQGIRQELGKLGYTSLPVIYVRTSDGISESMKEIRETFTAYRYKAEPLAAQVEFITSHIDDIQVLLLGESSGALLNNEVMNLLEDNDRVYSIQTGIPFIYRGSAPDETRTLAINDNGIAPDSLNNGDFWTIFRANLGRIPTYRWNKGHFLFYMRTPGHIYTWDHPGVNSAVTVFLMDHFGSN